MVKVKETSMSDWSIEVWLTHLSDKGYAKHIDLIKNALSLCELFGQDYAIETGETCFQHGIAMADVMVDLSMDQNSIAAALVYSAIQYADLSLDVIEEQLGQEVSRLVKGVLRMNALSSTSTPEKFSQKKSQLDNWRKMLLAMVDDVRVVLIKLCDRLCVLRSMSHMPDLLRQQIAHEGMNIYAPLAHRLGIGALKWEIEDLSFRYLYPEEYKIIAKGLRVNRLERDRYVNWIVEQLQEHIRSIHIENYSIYGRSKHIHSIYHKMQRKQVSLDQIYDATAVRILVDTKAQCYEVLGLIQNLWTSIVKEFDDYIAQPKSNGYQSLHTHVIGPMGRVFEVQIRTFDMHQQAEIGIAAHWKYKEGEHKEVGHERKIAWLRQVLSWHKEMEELPIHHGQIDANLQDDRVYVFTPQFDVIELPKGSTVLDFAYHLHTDLGHRCRGAKINGAIVTLNHVLQTGDRVEILKGKNPKPSRDWLSPQLNYLVSSRAKAKVFHWFRKQDFDLYCQQGQSILDRELKLLHQKTFRLESVVEAFHYQTIEELYAAVGRGDLKVAQILARIHPVLPRTKVITKPKARPLVNLSKQVNIEGLGHLLSHFAKCCHPEPGDEVLGYMTLGRGVSIHRKSCANILRANEEQQNRFLKVDWGGGTDVTSEQITLKVLVEAYDRPDLLKNITQILSKENIRLIALQTKVLGKNAINHVTMSIEMASIEHYLEFQKDLGELSGLVGIKRID